MSWPLAGKSLTADSRVQLREGVRLKHDPLSGQHVLLFPEGILELNDSAAEIMALCDGERSLTEIAASLATTHRASPDEILSDVVAYVSQLCDRRLLRERPEDGT